MAASVSIDGHLILWSLQASKSQKALTPIVTLQQPHIQKNKLNLSMITMDFDIASNELLILGQDRHIKYWSLKDKCLTKKLQADEDAEVTSMAVSPDGHLIVVGNAAGEMKLFTYEDFRLIHVETVHSGAVTAASISPDNTLILTADNKGQIFFWRI